MFKSKYSNFLTIVLVIAIIAIVIIASVLGVNAYKKHSNSKAASNAISRFDADREEEKQNENNTKGESLVEQEVVEKSQNQSSSGTRKVTYYENFVMIGHIEIPKINLKYPILEEETVKSLEKSVAVRYPMDAKLNTVGNVVIVGHNYRNGMFFSNLKKVAIGDKVKITDINGQTLVYTVYEKYETTPEDVEYITRDVGENIEVTLVTCTDDSSARIVLKAKV